MIFKRFIGFYILGKIVGNLVRIIWMHGCKDKRINDFEWQKKPLKIK